MQLEKIENLTGFAKVIDFLKGRPTQRAIDQKNVSVDAHNRRLVVGEQIAELRESMRSTICILEANPGNCWTMIASHTYRDGGTDSAVRSYRRTRPNIPEKVVRVMNNRLQRVVQPLHQDYFKAHVQEHCFCKEKPDPSVPFHYFFKTSSRKHEGRRTSQATKSILFSS